MKQPQLSVGVPFGIVFWEVRMNGRDEQTLQVKCVVFFLDPHRSDFFATGAEAKYQNHTF